MPNQRWTIETPDGEFGAYVATPEGEGPWPAVVAIQEIFGVNAVMREVCDRLAELARVKRTAGYPVARSWRRALQLLPEANIALIRQTMGQVLDGLPSPASQLEAMHRLLLRHACDAHGRSQLSATLPQGGAAGVLLPGAARGRITGGRCDQLPRVCRCAGDHAGASQKLWPKPLRCRS